jgi:hypothetical protein
MCLSQIVNNIYVNTVKYLNPNIQQSGNPDNVALEENSSKTQSFVFYQKKASSLQLADVWDKFKKASKRVCTSTIVVSTDPLSPIPSTFSAMKTPDNTEDPADSEPED